MASQLSPDVGLQRIQRILGSDDPISIRHYSRIGMWVSESIQSLPGRLLQSFQLNAPSAHGARAVMRTCKSSSPALFVLTLALHLHWLAPVLQVHAASGYAQASGAKADRPRPSSLRLPPLWVWGVLLQPVRRVCHSQDFGRTYWTPC